MPRHLALVVDPNSGTIAQLLPVLSQLGLKAVPARDGVEAMRLVDREMPALLLAETALDVLDGFALCARLRDEEPTHALPIVLMGSGDDRSGRLSALQCGADEFLLKPIDPEDARLRLAALLRRAGSLAPSNGDRPVEAPAPPPAGTRATAEDSARELFGLVTNLVNDVLEQARNDAVVELQPLEAVTGALVERSPEMVALALAKRELTDLAAHHVNVAVIGLCIARELEFPEEELRRFALLGLVHDLGMVKVPDAVVYAARKLSASEMRLVQDHPRHTFEILVAAGFEDLAALAYQEHEREKGQGYPRGLRGGEIHELAKIVGVADIYEACTHPRSYEKTFIPYDALQQLIEMRDVYFPARYIKALMNALTVYPSGSYVQLNTGEIGQVRATNRNNLMRPAVELFWSARGERLHPTKTVELAGSPFLFITKPLYEDQLPHA